MQFILTANLLEIEKKTFSKDGQEQNYYIGHFHQSGQGVDQLSLSRQAVESGVITLGMADFVCTCDNGKVKVQGMIL